MKVKQLTLGAMASNCYIVKKDEKVLIIDPGSTPETIISNISENEEVVAVLLTHGHFDHIGALDEIVNKYKCPVYLSKDEKKLIYDSSLSFHLQKVESNLTFIDDSFKVEDFDIKLHKTPGHTLGSVMFEIENYLFTGDTLFDQSIGRMDFPTGNEYQMQDSLNYIKTLDPKFIVCPGHNQMTTLEIQLQINPYLLGN